MIQKSGFIAVVDDEPTVLKATAGLLRSEGYVVGTFESPGQFLSAAPELGAACAVIDLRMPTMNGLELQTALTAQGSTMSLVFLTGNGDIHSSVSAMKQGAVDFLLKPVDSDDLLRAVAQGVERHARVAAEKEDAAIRKEIVRRIETLAPREREICERVSKGLLNKQIAADLNLAEITVKVHRARAMERLGVTSAAELARLFERAGWCER